MGATKGPLLRGSCEGEGLTIIWELQKGVVNYLGATKTDVNSVDACAPPLAVQSFMISSLQPGGALKVGTKMSTSTDMTLNCRRNGHVRREFVIV